MHLDIRMYCTKVFECKKGWYKDSAFDFQEWNHRPMKKFPLTVYKLTKVFSVWWNCLVFWCICKTCDLHVSGVSYVLETITNVLPTIIPNCMNSINIPNDMKKIVCMHYSRWRGMRHLCDSRASVPSRNCVVFFAAKTLISFFVLFCLLVLDNVRGLGEAWRGHGMSSAVSRIYLLISVP